MTDQVARASATAGSDEADDGLTDDDRVLRQWFSSLVLQDERFDDKKILKLGALALQNDEFRARILDDTAAVLEELGYEGPDGLRLRVYENTADTLNLVLPSPAASKSKGLREQLRSRTSAAFLDTVDDWDFGDISIPEDSNTGDTGGHDGHGADPITMTS